MEMFVVFRKYRNEYETLSIKDEDVKYLGVYIDALTISVKMLNIFPKRHTAYQLLEVIKEKI